MKLPTEPAPRPEIPPDHVRVLLAGPAKVGKSTLAASFCPNTTLLIDTQHGTDFIAGDHFVQHITNWQEFVAVVDQLVADPGDYRNVVIDLVSDVWRWCDIAHAGRNAVSAAASNDYQSSLRSAETVFAQTIGRLVGSDLGIWFIAHSTETKDGEVTRMRVSIVNKSIDEYLRGVVQYVWLLERRGPKPVLMTEPSLKFEAGGRTHVPSGEPDPRALWLALDKGLNPSKYAKKDKTAEPVEAAQPEAVAA